MNKPTIEKSSPKAKETEEKHPPKKCGIVMPISTIDGCSEAHWSDVLQILESAISDAGFQGDLVSNADDVGIIQKRIIQNLYDNPLVVCDVSGKNPNVMFELGMRLAFDKPTIVVKDDRTSYSFDTAPIEHIEYPRDLRYSKIIEFKTKLAEKIVGTYDRSISDPSYTTFLKNFGEFKVAKIDQKEVTGIEILLDEVRTIKNALRRIDKDPWPVAVSSKRTSERRRYSLTLKGPDQSIEKALNYLNEFAESTDLDVKLTTTGDEKKYIFIIGENLAFLKTIMTKITDMLDISADLRVIDAGA